MNSPQPHICARRHPFVRPMVARSPHEHPRASTTLELFFDLVFVVAIAFAGVQLHHAVAADHAWQGALSFSMVFFAIWWAWMGFTWFASAFDTDDVPYRLAVFVQMAGALIIAGGVAAAFEHQDWRMVVVGYVVMRTASMAQWLRAAAQARTHRSTCLRYALGVFLVQLGWIANLWTPPGLGLYAFTLLVLCELLVPVWAESAGKTPYHPHHIAERYGLMTIIVLGESVLATATALQGATFNGPAGQELMAFCVGALGTVFCMWWIYFEDEDVERLNDLRAAFVWGYGHLLVFGSAAAVGAGLAAQVDFISGKSAAGSVASGLGLSVPAGLFLLTTWYLKSLAGQRSARSWLMPAAALAVVATAWLPAFGTLAIALVLCAVLIVGRRPV